MSVAALATGALSAPGVSPPFDGKGLPCTLAVTGPYNGTAVILTSSDGGETFQVLDPQPLDPRFALGLGSPADLQTVPGVLFAVEAVAPAAAAWTGVLAYVFNALGGDVTVTVAPDRSVQFSYAGGPGRAYGPGQQITMPRETADQLAAGGSILPRY